MLAETGMETGVEGAAFLFVLVNDGFFVQTNISKVHTQNTYYEPLQSH